MTIVENLYLWKENKMMTILIIACAAALAAIAVFFKRDRDRFRIQLSREIKVSQELVQLWRDHIHISGQAPDMDQPKGNHLSTLGASLPYLWAGDRQRLEDQDDWANQVRLIGQQYNHVITTDDPQRAAFQVLDLSIRIMTTDPRLEIHHQSQPR